MIHLSGDGSRVCGEMSCVSLVGAGKEKPASLLFFRGRWYGRRMMSERGGVGTYRV